MAVVIYHEIGTRRAPLADVRVPALAAWDCHVKYAKNDSGSLSLKVSALNTERLLLCPLISEVVVMDDDIERWRGRIASTEADEAGTTRIECVGVLDYLHDTLMPQYELTGNATYMLNAILFDHNSKPIDARKQFAVGNVTITGSMELKTSGQSSSWDALSGLVSKYGGYIAVRRADGKNYIDWTAEETHESDRVIEAGVSLSAIKATIGGASDFATVMYGYGKSTDSVPLSFAAVNNGLPYVTDPDAVAAFGWIEAAYADGEIEDAAALLAKTTEELNTRVAKARSVEITAVDRLDLLGSEMLAIGYKIRVIVPAIGIDELMPVDELDVYPYDPKKTKIGCCASVRALSQIIKEQLS